LSLKRGGGVMGRVDGFPVHAVIRDVRDKVFDIGAAVEMRSMATQT